MVRRIYAFSLLVAFAFTALFGLYITFASPMHGETGCIAMPGETVLCATSAFEHISHWQSTFAIVLVVVVLLFALVTVWYIRRGAVASAAESPGKIRLQERIPIRPTFFQELYSQGILNRKEPHMIPSVA